MSKLGEYIKMFGKGLAHPQQVVEGITNSVKMEYGLLPEDEQEEIIRRRLICSECPMMSKNRENFTTTRTEDFCTLCSCPILTKSASLNSSCGAKTYNERHPEDPKPVLWEAYKKQ